MFILLRCIFVYVYFLYMFIFCIILYVYRLLNADTVCLTEYSKL